MNDASNAILARAMTLDASERAEIAGALLDSLDPECEEGVDLAWRVEVRRRMVALDTGAMETMSWDALRARVRDQVNERL